MAIRTELKSLYLKYWEILSCGMISHSEFAESFHPHLLSTNKDFERDWNDAVIRIMFFGMNTNDWGDGENIYAESPEKAIDSLMKLYENFYFGGGNWRYGQVFWNYIFALEQILPIRLVMGK